jgi:hypothetical protein
MSMNIATVLYEYWWEWCDQELPYSVEHSWPLYSMNDLAFDLVAVATGTRVGKVQCSSEQITIFQFRSQRIPEAPWIFRVTIDNPRSIDIVQDHLRKL